MAAFRRKPTGPGVAPKAADPIVDPLAPDASTPAPPRPIGRPISTPLHDPDPDDLPPDTIPDGDEVLYAVGEQQVVEPRSGMSRDERVMMAERMQREGFLSRLAVIDTALWPELERIWLEAPF